MSGFELPSMIMPDLRSYSFSDCLALLHRSANHTSAE